MAVMSSWASAILAVGLVSALAAVGVQGRKGFGDGGQEYGYVDVRQGAHMFYWLYYVRGGDSPAGKPLVIWLQGGPGASSSSFGNFEEIGPLDKDLVKRNATWVNHVNLIFVDNPVGTGYSYVDHQSQLATDNRQIAADLVAFTKTFMSTYPQFQNAPLYVFSESYGGKMAVEFALNLHKAQKEGAVRCNLKGVGLIDPWISPIDSVLNWAPYLLNTGNVDRRGSTKLAEAAERTRLAVHRGRYFEALQLEEKAESTVRGVAENVNMHNILGMVDARGHAAIAQSARRTKDYVDKGRWSAAKDEWAAGEQVVAKWANRVDYYNILTRIAGEQQRALAVTSRRTPLERLMQRRDEGDSDDDVLDRLMDGKVKPALGVIPDRVKHQSSSSAVFNALGADFMRPVTDIVEQLLNNTDVKVAVVSGQLDLLVNTPGTLAWAERLKWKLGDFWVNEQRRDPLVVDGIIEGFVKSTTQFFFFWISRAGHMVPLDNPPAAIEVLKVVTGLK